MKFSELMSSRITRPQQWVLISCALAFLQPDVLRVAVGTECFPGLFIFGDSMVDAGNAIAAYPDRFSRIEARPYGVAWPGHAADRFSDGKLFGDFSAWAIGHSPSSAYLRSVQTLLYSGANFAVSGSTVLDNYPTESLSDPNFLLTSTPYNLEHQILWWRRFRVRVNFALTYGYLTTSSIIPYSSINSSLHLVLTGATDYLVQYSANFSEHQVLASVPFIVNRIAKNLETLHEFGAETILVINLPPLGCTPTFLSMFPAESRDDYDSHGCVKKVNTAIVRHNQLLFRAVSRLQTKYNSTSSFVYADFFQTTYDIVKDPQYYGFEKTTFQKACCGVGGAYNFSPNKSCGSAWVDDHGDTHIVTACQDSSRHLTWDGYHFSQSVTRVAALNFFEGRRVHPSKGLLPNNCKANFTLFWANYTLNSEP